MCNLQGNWTGPATAVAGLQFTMRQHGLQNNFSFYYSEKGWVAGTIVGSNVTIPGYAGPSRPGCRFTCIKATAARTDRETLRRARAVILMPESQTKFCSAEGSSGVMNTPWILYGERKCNESRHSD